VATEHPGFLADIVANPADDTPRLVYADWLDEHGDGDRAEFIRVQCEIEGLREANVIACDRTGDLLTEWGKFTPRCRCRPCRLRRREYLCSRRHIHVEWEWGVCPGGVRFGWERGFLESASLPLADWWQYGPDVVRLCPTLRSAWLTDREPAAHAGRLARVYYWVGGFGPPVPCTANGWEAHYIPAEWLSAMEPPLTSDHSHGYQGWPTREEATRGLSDVALAWARAAPVGPGAVAP
jgi:uncharacterized protein (TIGR02996 family)